METIAAIASLLKGYNQTHLIKDLEDLDDHQKNKLLLDLKNFDQIFSQKNKSIIDFSEVTPLKKCSEIIAKDQELGEQELKRGKIGCIVLAGGEGTRLGFNLPKGMFPISVIQKKTLFQIICERMLAAQEKYEVELHIAIMLSSSTEKIVLSYFEENSFFGLKREQVDFFVQKAAPYEDNEGKWFWKESGKLAQGSMGNGGVFHSFTKSKVNQKWKTLGVKNCTIIPIDNPLADPFDVKMIGMHRRRNSDITLKSIAKNKDESTGVLCLMEESLVVVEYNQIKEDIPGFANSGIYVFSIDFIDRLREKAFYLHRVKKKVTRWSENKFIKFLAVKYESYIFDALLYTDKISVLCSERDICFSPLKEKKDIPIVQRALLENDYQILEEILGTRLRNSKKDLPEIELSYRFHYPTDDLIKKGKKVSIKLHGYIESL